MFIVIDAPHFYAGVTLKNHVVIKAAPIVKYMIGWNVERVGAYCTQKNWKILISKGGSNDQE